MSDEREIGSSCGDMTLKDWFAGQAITGMMSVLLEAARNGENSGPEDVALRCYQIADAMLEERARDSDDDEIYEEIS